MKILGIETSCDETAVSLIEADGDLPAGRQVLDANFSFTVLGDTVLSQTEVHAQYGGVYPNLAKREHARNLVPILINTLTQAGELAPSNGPIISQETLGHMRELLEREPELFVHLANFLATYQKPRIDALAVTAGPGLEPALWVGINFARALSLAWDLPIVAVNHMEGHVIISSLRDGSLDALQFPALALLISGGHTELDLMRDWLAYEQIGATRDDAIGEAFDKTARLLGLPYPGGPALSKLAAEARTQNLPEPDEYHFTRPMLDSGDLDFSFSGLKTAVRVAINGQELTNEQKKQIARSFEDTVADVLVAKVRTALEAHGARTLVVGGGVSANSHIRTKLQELIEQDFSDTTLLLPPADLATDNALMIALAGYFHAKRGEFAEAATMRAAGNLSIAQ